MSVTEDSLLIASKRPRGRPRIEEPRSSVSTWIWAKHHDRLIQMAKQRETSVSALVKDLIGDAVRKRT